MRICEITGIQIPVHKKEFLLVGYKLQSGQELAYSIHSTRSGAQIALAICMLEEKLTVFYIEEI